jgi:inosose dehydratase
MTTPNGLSTLRLGTAPDSWGVWFPEDDHQVTWKQYLDELPKAGYVWTELGPKGFLPQDPQRLRDELARRGLRVCGGTVFAALRHGKEALDKAMQAFGREAKLLSAVGAKYLLHLPEQYTDMHTGAAVDAAQLNEDHWTNLVSGTNELGRIIYEEYGVQLVFHPHVDTHVESQQEIERFLDDTDPRYVNLCLDTGHIAYAVEPPYGEPAMPTLLDALAALNRELYSVIEQDLYSVEPDVPLPIAARTAGYFVACGLGPVRRWPYQPVA